MSSGKLEGLPFRQLTGTFQNIALNISPASTGFLFEIQRAPWVPVSASVWLIWSLQYSDGNRSPQNWIFAEFNPVTNKSFEYSVSLENSPYLSRTLEDRVLLTKLYTRRWVYSLSPSVATTSEARRNVILGSIRAKEY